jgi:sigma-B regulation protein RsbU (phosphoserine phosphatase)
VDDVRKDPRYVEFPNSERVRSELVIPLMLQGRLIGVLELESINLGAFSAEHERMLAILGSYIAIALENSRLYETSRENQLRLQSDLDTARDIQRQLLPQHPHKMHGSISRPCTNRPGSLPATFTIFFPMATGHKLSPAE